MNTLIVYGTKHGTTEKCSKILKEKLQGDVTIVNVKKDIVPNLNLYDNIIIGGSIYMGKIQKEIKNFCIKNVDVLNKKRVGLFICGMNEENSEVQFNNAFPKEVINNSIVKELFGGEAILKNMNFLERFIMKKVAKIDKDISKLLNENIDKFAKIVNN